MLDYQPHRGTERQREAGVHWMRNDGVEATRDRVVVTSGLQHAMAVVIAAITSPGDTLLVEELTYCGVKTLARVLHLEVEGLPIDEAGLLPAGLRAACERGVGKALYCMPRLHNPTAVSMSQRRRQEMARTILGPFGYRSSPASQHGWLVLPEPWTASQLTAKAARHGVLVNPSSEFAVDGNQPEAIRICLGPASDRATLQQGLGILASLLKERPEPRQLVV